jgi:hypothetical protein
MTTRKRAKADKSTMDAYADFMRRAVRAFGKKAGEGDVAALPELLKIQAQLDEAIVDAVGSLISAPWNYSWQQVTDSINADRLARDEKPLTRQAVQQRYAPKLAAKGIRPGRKIGGQPTELR